MQEDLLELSFALHEALQQSINEWHPQVQDPGRSSYGSAKGIPTLVAECHACREGLQEWITFPPPDTVTALVLWPCDQGDREAILMLTRTIVLWL